MKCKKITKKLVINKNTIANLSIGDMSALNGGDDNLLLTLTFCNGRPCMTYGTSPCTAGWECDETGPIVCP